MASNTVTVGNTYIRYSADSSGSITITVADSSTGQTFASVFEPSGYNTGAALNEAQDQLNRKIRDAQRVINNPASTPEQIQSAQKTLAEATDASNYLSSNGNSDLQALIAQVQAQQPVATPPPADAPLAPPPPAATGSVNDDSGIAPSNPAGGPPNANVNTPNIPSNSSPNLPTEDVLLPEDPNTGNDENVTSINTTGSDNTLPGKRLQNPLGQYSSYDYIISLYMVSPDAYNAWVLSGYKNVNAFRNAVSPNNPDLAANQGTFLIAQSGGINNQSSQRAPFFDFDYYIDNLKYDSKISPKATGAPTTDVNINFDIIEPYGFSFLSNLRRAGDLILKQPSKTTNTNNNNAKKSGTDSTGPNNALRQHFILGVKFIGYDANGNILTSNAAFDGGILDPNGANNDPSDTFEYYIDINLTTLKFDLEGGPSKYHITAASISQDKATGSANGTTLDAQSITANTVGSAINQLFANQTKAQTKQVKNGDRKIANTYSVKWMDGTETIRNATIVSPADLDKSKWAGSPATNTQQSNPKTASKTKANNKARTINIGNGISLVQAISNIIQQSSYMRDALKVVYDSDIQSNDTKKDYNQQPGGDNPQISWFNVHPQLLNPQWDNKTKSWAYDITYVITKYDTPVTDSVYANQKTGTNYPGPFKRYRYWYTGKNTEVLKFSLSFNQSYYVTVVGNADQEEDKSKQNSDGTTSQEIDDPTEVPRVPGTQTNQSRTGGKGPAMEAQNNYLTSLYDQGAYANCHMTIFGDPDFLISPNPTGPNDVYKKYYQSTGHQINPQSSMVLVEVDIVEAVDYDNDTGVMNLNNSIFFFPIPTELATAIDANGEPVVQGIPFSVNNVNSEFSGGKFTQQLTMVGNNLTTYLKDKDTKDAKKKTSGKAPKKANSTTKNTGTKQDPPLSTIPQASPNYGFGAGYAASL